MKEYKQMELPLKGGTASEQEQLMQKANRLADLGKIVEDSLDTPFYLQNTNYQGQKRKI